MKNTLFRVFCPPDPAIHFNNKYKGMLALILCLFQVLPGQSNGLAKETKVSISVKSVALRDVLLEIERQSQLHFFYSTSQINSRKKVNLELSGTLEQVLDHLFKGTDISWQIDGRQVLLKKRGSKESRLRTYNDIPLRDNMLSSIRMEPGLIRQAPGVSFADRLVRGKVTDEAGAALPGVSILVKGTHTGTSTDQDGAFSINVAGESAVLVFSFVGYETREMSVGNQAVIDLSMTMDNKSLEELVVVGFGTQKKVNLTGSVSTVDFDEKMANRPITSASQALSGRVPGLWVSQSSGQPGKDNALLRVRGWGSLNDSNPLVLIDGVEGSIDQLNPQDIQNVSILKDAASASIYGSKAANGVILVTTKSGNLNQKPQIAYTSYFGLQSVEHNYDYITDSATFMELWNQAQKNAGRPATFPQNVIDDFRNNDDPYLYPNTDFFDVMFRNAAIFNNNLSLSGGAGTNKYFLSVNHQKHDGVLLNTTSKKYSVNLNLESKVHSRINVGARLFARIKDTHEPFEYERIPYVWSNGAYPFTAPYNRDGTFGAVQALNPNGTPILGNRNPLIAVHNGFNDDKNYLTRLSLFGDVQILPGLVYKTNFTGQYDLTEIERFTNEDLGYTSTGVSSPNLDYASFGEINRAIRQHNNRLNTVFFNTLNYNRTFGRQHDLGAILGTQIESFTNTTTLAQSRNPPHESITQVSGGTESFVVSGNKGENRMLSYFARLNYAFGNKYLMEANLRADGSSRFAKSRRWGVFPGISLGWRLGAEQFMEQQKVFSDLKIRASLGQLGNQNIAGNWPYMESITQTSATSYSFNGGLSPGAALINLANESLTWETTTVKDIGLEAFFIDNRLSLETVFFNKRTHGIIVSLPIPKTLGAVNAPFENVGEMLNKGVEINLSFLSKTSARNNFGYRLSANFAYVTNEVTKFRKDSPNQLYLIREGVSYRSLFAYNAVGIYQTDQEAKEHMHSNGYLPVAGDLKYEDVNEDGRLDFRDQMVIGNSIPKINYGANLEFSYKGFDLSFLLQGVSKVTINMNDRWSMPFGATGGGITSRWLNAWTPENPDTDLPAVKPNDSWNLRRPSSFWAHDLSFLKIKNIQLGYKFPPQFLGLKHLYVYANLQNYFTFINKGYEGFDPEKNIFSFEETGERGLSNLYPMQRIVSAGLNLNF